MNPRALQRHLRNLTLCLAGAGVLYLYWRFDTTTLPTQGCSPVARFAPGETLLIDLHPRRLERGDAVLFRGPAGELYLGLVRRVRAEGGDDAPELWVETDAADCPGQDSDELGWIARADVAGRVLMVWPW